MTTTSEKILQQIAKELHELNKKLDRLGQASIFEIPSTMQVHVESAPSISYTYEEDDPLEEAGLYIKEIIPNRK